MELNPSLFLTLNPYLIYCFHNPTSLRYEKGFKYLERITFAYELEYINSGEGEMKLNERIIKVREGDLIFKTPGTKVQGIACYSSVILFFAPFYHPDLERDYPPGMEIELHDSEPRSLVAQTPDFKLPELWRSSHSDELNTLFLNTYHHYIHRTQSSMLQAKINLLQIIALIAAEMVPTINRHNDPDLKYYTEIMQAEEYIRLNYRSKLSVPEIAGMFNMSVGFFNKLFKKYLRQTPIQYLIKYRLEKAKELLCHTSKTAKEITFECGFNSDTYFETLFTRFEGISPTQYRKEQTAKYFTGTNSLV